MKTAASQNNRTGLVAFLRRHPWLTAALTLVLLLGALYVLVEWRAEQRWQRYAADARSRGARVHPEDEVRPQIPAEQNFAELPMLKKALAGGGGELPFKLPKWRRTAPAIRDRKPSTYEDIPPSLADAAKGEKINWKEWQDYFVAVGFLTETTDEPARDVLRALEHYAPQFQQWSEWRTTRTQCQFSSRVSETLFTTAAMMFDLRLTAHLAVGDSAAAYADFQDGLQIGRALHSTRSLVDGVLRVGTMHFLLEHVGGGLRDHSWTDAELKMIEADLGALRLWEDYRENMEGGRSSLNVEVEKLMNTSFRERARMGDAFGLLGSRPAIVYQLTPRSVFRDNELRLNQHLDELTAGLRFNPDRPTMFSTANLTGSYEKEYYFLSDLLGDAYTTFEHDYLRLQILVDQARLACALERCRLARGAYPATLAELVPEFIDAAPIDIYAGAPYRYQRVGTASFRLYSVGENRKDDGGIVKAVSSGQTPPDRVWRFSPVGEK